MTNYHLHIFSNLHVIRSDMNSMVCLRFGNSTIKTNYCKCFAI